MLNRFKNTGLIILIVSLFAVVDGFGQVPCPTCPKGITAPSSVSNPLQGFNGFTSEVKTFDGTTPTCYTPTAKSLNGHLRGINNALCAYRTRIDSLVGGDTVLISRIDSLINAIDVINTDISSNYNTSIISSDSSVNIITGIVGSVLQFNLSVDIDSIKAKIVRNLDYSCLGVPNNFDSIMNKLIEVACYQSDPASDSCKVWTLYSTNTVGSTAGATTVSVTPYSSGAVPSDMCLTKIEYIYTLYDGSGNSVANGLINGSTVLGSATNWTIPLGYIQGARTIKIVSRFWKEKCTSHRYCGTQDSILTATLPVFVLSPLTANNDAFTNTSTSSINYNLVANDVVPYGVFSSLLNIGASKGNAILSGTNLQYTPTSSGIDTFAYVITDIYGQTDTAFIYSTNNISSSSTALNITGTIDMCVQSGTSIRIFNTLSITNDIGSVKLYGMTYTNDTGLVVSILNPLLPTFTGLQSIANGSNTISGNLYNFSNLSIADINSDGGTITITIMATNAASVDKLVDITVIIPSGISSSYACSTLLENMAYTITEYDLP